MRGYYIQGKRDNNGIIPQIVCIMALTSEGSKMLSLSVSNILKANDASFFSENVTRCHMMIINSNKRKIRNRQGQHIKRKKSLVHLWTNDRNQNLFMLPSKFTIPVLLPKNKLSDMCCAKSSLVI